MRRATLAGDSVGDRRECATVCDDFRSRRPLVVYVKLCKKLFMAEANAVIGIGKFRAPVREWADEWLPRNLGKFDEQHGWALPAVPVHSCEAGAGSLGMLGRTKPAPSNCPSIRIAARQLVASASRYSSLTWNNVRCAISTCG